MVVHNHGPEEGAGLACNESRLPDGSLRGACLLLEDVIQGKRSVNDVRRMAGMNHARGREAARRLTLVLETEVTFTPMSSSYYVLCLSHDPAIHISELSRDSDMREALIMGIGDHRKCDTVLMRVSGAPVEFGCPGIKNTHCHGHREVEWLDADVIRLLYYVVDDPREAVQGLFNRYVFHCWPKDRLHRLRYEMGVIKEES